MKNYSNEFFPSVVEIEDELTRLVYLRLIGLTSSMLKDKSLQISKINHNPKDELDKNVLFIENPMIHTYTICLQPSRYHKSIISNKYCIGHKHFKDPKNLIYYYMKSPK